MIIEESHPVNNFTSEIIKLRHGLAMPVRRFKKALVVENIFPHLFYFYRLCTYTSAAL